MQRHSKCYKRKLDTLNHGSRDVLYQPALYVCFPTVRCCGLMLHCPIKSAVPD